MTASTGLGHVKVALWWLVLLCVFHLFLPFTPTEIIFAILTAYIISP